MIFFFHHGTETIKFPIEISILSYVLPKIDFPVGFFGIDPLPYSYFPDSAYGSLRKKYRHLALNALGEAGFTTFTGLPEGVGDLEELFKESSKWGMQTVFSYGGQFPQSMIDLSRKTSNMNDSEFYEKSARELKSLLSNRKWPKIVHTFSDEAGGYSDKLVADIEMAKKLKKYYPFLSLGGFGSFNGGDSNKLNSYFDYGFYSAPSRNDITKLKENGQHWGFYNTSAGNLDDPRFSLGLGLYMARLNGLSSYLEWHATAFSNYPYYDFDGREADNVMFYPTVDGKLLRSLRFEFAVEGLHAYRKLKLLENTLANNAARSEDMSSAKFWLEKMRKENYFYSSKQFMNQKNNNFRMFEFELNQQLKKIFFKK